MGFELFILCGVNAYIYNEIGLVTVTVIELLLVAALLFCIICSVRIGMQISKKEMADKRIIPKDARERIM